MRPSLRLHLQRLLLASALALAACATRPSRGVDSPPRPAPLDAALADRATDALPSPPLDATADASADAAPEAAEEESELCGVRGLTLAQLRPLDPALFPAAQRRSSPAWAAPGALRWAAPDPARDAFHRGVVLLLGDPEEESCVAFAPCEEGTAEHPPVRGPFAGMPGSDATWSAHALCGSRLWLGLFDGAGQPRALRDDGEDLSGEMAWTGRGVYLDAVGLFADGVTVGVLTYMTADGTSDWVLRLWGAAGGELRELLREGHPQRMGAPARLVAEVAGERGPAPSVRITWQRGRTREREGTEEWDVVWGPAARVTRRFDARAVRFR